MPIDGFSLPIQYGALTKFFGDHNMKKSLCLMVSAMALTLAACSNDSDVNEIDEACENITCGDHGTCLPGSDASVVCLCDPGYHLDPFDNTTCIADEAYPCAQIDCGGNAYASLLLTIPRLVNVTLVTTLPKTTPSPA